MASKKKKLTPLQKEYNKQYKAYIKRIESAREAGFLIPEEHVKIKKDKPRTRDIEALKKVTRKSLQQEVKKNKLEYVNQFTGEILTGGRAVDISRQRRPQYIEPERPNYERPTTFDEAMYVKDKIQDYFKTYKVPESNKDFMAERIMETQLRSIRGPEFDFDEWKKQEQKNGWLFKDPNRPLEKEEIEYIQNRINTDVDEDEFKDDFGHVTIVSEYIDDLRGWNPEYNYYDKYFENQRQTGQYPSDIFDLHEEYEPQFEEKTWDRNERPSTVNRPSSDIASEPLETIALNNLQSRLESVDPTGESYPKNKQYQKGVIARQNKQRLQYWLEEKINRYGMSEVDKALTRASNSGRAFQVYLLYSDEKMSAYLTDLENFLLDKSDYYETAEMIESGDDNGDEY